MQRELVVLETHPNSGGSWVGIAGTESEVKQYLENMESKGALDYVKSIHQLSDGADDEIEEWIEFEDFEPVGLKDREIKEIEALYYLIHVWGDIEPELHGPYGKEGERDLKARQLRQEEGNEHGLYPLDMKFEDGETRLLIDTYSGNFFEE